MPDGLRAVTVGHIADAPGWAGFGDGLQGQPRPRCLSSPNRQNDSKWASDQGFHLRGRSLAC